jgi:uncharacterized protein YbjT (DUF2867 family)
MNKILVFGASGFVGSHVAKALLADGYEVRCLARNPARVQGLAIDGCEIVKGDISDLASMQQALKSVQAAYISVHTLSPQQASPAGQGFMEVEMNGLQNIVTACQTHGVRRLIYLTFLGSTFDSPSAWVRGRWRAEQFLLKSGLDVTVIRPGQIAGVGGHGFNMMVSQARRSPTLMLANGKQKWRNIAIDDLVYYLIGVLNEPRTYGHCYDVGCDDIMTNDQMVDIAADVLGRNHPIKIHFPRALLVALAPLVERVSKLPEGSIRGFVDTMQTDAIGDPTPIRAILPRPPLSYRQAVERALIGSHQGGGTTTCRSRKGKFSGTKRRSRSRGFLRDRPAYRSRPGENCRQPTRPGKDSHCRTASEGHQDRSMTAS